VFAHPAAAPLRAQFDSADKRQANGIPIVTRGVTPFWPSDWLFRGKLLFLFVVGDGLEAAGYCVRNRLAA
jgi:hypothetical protein